MSSQNAVRVAYEPLREIVFGDIPATYTPTNPAATFYLPSQNPIREIKIKNTTNANVYLTFDAPNLNPALMIDRDYIIANSGDVSDYCSNRSEPSGLLEQALNTQVSIRYDSTLGQVAPTQGKVTLTFIYASQD